MTDLILASFDVLANAMYRNEPAESITLLRSFLVNKLPVFLNNSGKYSKDDLVVQCHASPGKIEELIGELENMEGNAGEIAGALTEVS